MTASHPCPRCGRDLSDDAPHGLCPACLIAVALAASEETGVRASGISGAPDPTAAPSEARSVTTFLNDFQQGDSSAFNELWNRYFFRLVAMARRRLQHQRRLAGVDEEDIALSAFKSFHRRARRGDFPRLEDRDDLWVQLVTLTRQKLVDQQRREGAIKRGRGWTRLESEPGRSHAGGDQTGLDAIVGEEPDPAFSAMMTEQCRLLLDRLGDDNLRQVALAKMGMYTNQEIAGKFGRSLSWVNRKIDLIRSIWEAAENPGN